jgi:putative oxidoreductase
MHKWTPLLLSVLRIVAGLLFVAHGTQKVLGFPTAPPHEGPAHAMSPLMAHLAPASGFIELIGGALLIIGLFTRVVAFICSGEMAVAYFTAHAPNGMYPINNHGELPVLYCFVFLYLFAAGGGPLSLDALVRKRP